MKAFVTGSNGFLGVNLCKELHKQNWEVIGLHRSTSDTSFIDPLPITMLIGEIDNKDELLRAIPEDCDAVFHVAANTSMWSKENKQQYNDNVIGTQNVIEACIEKGVKKLIYTSSITSFGRHRHAIDETTPSTAMQSGINYYVTKYEAERKVLSCDQSILPTVVLNPAHIMGPYDKHNWMELFQMTLVGKLPGIPGGRGVYCHVEEVAKAHIAAYHKGINGEQYLLGGPEASFLDLINEIQRQSNLKLSKKTTPKFILHFLGNMMNLVSKITGKEPNLTPEKATIVTENTLCDDTKARTQLDYVHVPLKDIVADTLAWIKITV